MDPDSAPARVAAGWDVVVLQEYSTRPTDAVGPAEQFKDDATYFHDLARESREGARVILYETWARRHRSATGRRGTFDGTQTTTPAAP